MNLVLPAAIGAIERLPFPDAVTRAGIGALVGWTRRKLAVADPAAERAFAASMADFPIAEHVDAANSQHYELPARFFELCLGPRRKYSCCFYETDQTSLAEAEERALALTCAHAALADGQQILELGCGWGSLTLWMAEHYPKSEITAVSNSNSQRAHILAEALRRGFGNVKVVTADMNVFEANVRYDRIVSVEMFEHMANWRALLARTRNWLTRDGLLFIHVFTHANAPYRFDHRDPTDWVARHFFTGGIMPSRTLLSRFDDLYAVSETWNWSGTHYARTAQDWLANYDANSDRIERLFDHVYGKDAKLWLRRWRLFYLATAGLFGYGGGETWGVTHYRLTPVA
jgi:cyclopropane-fatty-acyl-phospholipid synthase